MLFRSDQLRSLAEAGAVGEVCMRYVDADGAPVASDLDTLTIGVTLDQLSRARRRWAVVGGSRKLDAIRGVLRGGWVDVLVTDLATAHQLATDERSPRSSR